MKDTLWLIHFWECVQPFVFGPYANDEERVKAARQIIVDEGNAEEQAFGRLDIDSSGTPKVSPFFQGELDDVYDLESTES